jgi:hypothetical protein
MTSPPRKLGTKENNDIKEVTTQLKLSMTTLIRLDTLSQEWGLSRSATVEKLLEELMADEESESPS